MQLVHMGKQTQLESCISSDSKTHHIRAGADLLYASCFLNICEISGFRREEDETCALLGCYAASSLNFLPALQDDQSAPRLQVSRILPTGCPETSVINYHYSLRYNTE